MIFEAIIETVAPAVGRVLVYIFIDIIFQTICYSTGFWITRLVTFGKHPKTFRPPKYLPRKHIPEPQGWVAIIGILFWFVVLVGVLIFVS